MDKLNQAQLKAIEQQVDNLTCPHCTDGDDKDCSSCEINQTLRDNIIGSLKVTPN